MRINMVCANHIVFCSETKKSATENNRKWHLETKIINVFQLV